MNMFHNALRKIYYRVFDPLRDRLRRGLVVGKNFAMFDGVILDYSHPWHIEIGDDVTLAPRVMIIAHDASMKKYVNYARVGKVKIGSRVFVGAGSIILPGVTIGHDVVIGAGSVVSRDVPDSQVVAGNPARIICTLEEFLRRKRDEMVRVPCFGEEYAERNKVTPAMKQEMNVRMKDRIGYLV
ncbi:MAG: DapH/DapD/GlmU-related protein [bacterium]